MNEPKFELDCVPYEDTKLKSPRYSVAVNAGLLKATTAPSSSEESDGSDVLNNSSEELDPEEEDERNEQDDSEHESDSEMDCEEFLKEPKLPDRETGVPTKGRPSSCVFVASLSSAISDDALCVAVTKHFKKWGKLDMVKVLRDPSNRPYAFVQYTNDQDAKLALREAQHSLVGGRAIRCEPARVNRTLFIETSVKDSFDEKRIEKMLQNFGEIEHLVCKERGPGFIRHYKASAYNEKQWFCKFAYRDDAIRAYADLRSRDSWTVEWAQNLELPDSDDEGPEIVIDRCSIFVGQLNSMATKMVIEERFGRHGEIVETTLVNRPNRNFAFIKYANEASAALAVEKENHAMLLNKTMHVQYREMYKVNSRRSVEPRLSLAPPPVNFPTRRSNGLYSSNGSVVNIVNNNSNGKNGWSSSLPSRPRNFNKRVVSQFKSLYSFQDNQPNFESLGERRAIARKDSNAINGWPDSIPKKEIQRFENVENVHESDAVPLAGTKESEAGSVDSASPTMRSNVSKSNYTYSSANTSPKVNDHHSGMKKYTPRSNGASSYYYPMYPSPHSGEFPMNTFDPVAGAPMYYHPMYFPTFDADPNMSMEYPQQPMPYYMYMPNMGGIPSMPNMPIPNPGADMMGAVNMGMVPPQGAGSGDYTKGSAPGEHPKSPQC
ncbi:unnamed protein product [Kuraishia capsulata CBS 1993]|uniref:RRM domain-containing protein n=1 Tax=Kuraishia capsulata CBS 1993 TaxID=1382522 RepID=W6MQ21_9ASCO|nr:uncharacterized protein KUCA_T00004809001 [Kuraishia capsulata CBS 1993]CDK28824.1 unnamed protein product [Kuraishia capsulata CBS 1993]